jgi:hypothetical protein
MKRLIFLCALCFSIISVNAQFTDTSQLNRFVLDTIKDRRPDKVTAAQIQKAFLGTSKFLIPSPYAIIKDSINKSAWGPGSYFKAKVQILDSASDDLKTLHAATQYYDHDTVAASIDEYSNNGGKSIKVEQGQPGTLYYGQYNYQGSQMSEVIQADTYYTGFNLGYGGWGFYHVNALKGIILNADADQTDPNTPTFKMQVATNTTNVNNGTTLLIVNDSATISTIFKANGGLAAKGVNLDYVIATDANFTATVKNYYIELPTITANRNLTLPNPTTCKGQTFVIINVNASVSTWVANYNFYTAAGESTGGATMSNSQTFTIVSNGTQYKLIALN